MANPDLITAEERIELDKSIAREERLGVYDDDDLNPLEEAQQAEEKELVSAMATFAGESGAKLYIYRIQGKDNRGGEFIESFGVNDMSHDELMNRLRDTHFGGRFKVQIRSREGHIKMNQVVSTVTTEPPKEVEKDTSGDTFANILMAMQAQQAESRKDSQDLMMRMNQMQMEAQQNNMNTITAMIQAMNNNKSEQPAFGPMEMVSLMAGMQKMFKDDTPKTDPIEMLIKGMELGKDNNGGDENVAQTLIKSVAPALGNMAQMMPTAPQPMPQPVPQPMPEMAPMPAPEMPPQIEPQPVSDDEMLLMKMQAFKPYLDTLIHAAQQNADPVVYANYLMDQLDSKDIELVLSEENYAKLYEFMPGLAPLKPWLDACRTTTLQFINEEKEPEAPVNIDSGEEVDQNEIIEGQESPEGEIIEQNPDTTTDSEHSEG